MKSIVLRSTSILITALILATAFLARPAATSAAPLGALCNATPGIVHIGGTITIECAGFSPNVYVFAYRVEPSGTAIAFGSFKTDAQGNVSILVDTDFGLEKAKTGTWKMVIEQTGLAHSVLRRGIVEYTIQGGTEGVSGASLTANPSLIYKPEVAYSFQNLDLSSGGSTIRGRITNVNEVTTNVTGSGFAPGEIVSFWMDPPNGGCGNYTGRIDARFIESFPGVDVNAQVVENEPVGTSGIQWIGDAKADAAGNISGIVAFNLFYCEGVYHIVGRGNTSGAGADTFITLVGNAVTTTASLSATPGVVGALFSPVQFTGSGFASGEHVTCWLTSPDGIVSSIPGISEFNGTQTAPGAFLLLKDKQIFAGPGGGFSFGIITGSVYAKFDGTATGIGQNFSNRTFEEPVQSEGALGQYSASCRGDTSGKIGIATYMLSGNELTP